MVREEVVKLAKEIAGLAADLRWPGVKPRLLVVGGFVRDMVMLGGADAAFAVAKDVDVEVYGVSPGRLAEFLLSRYPGRVRDVGQSFGILKVVFPIEGGAGFDIDVAVPRRERKVGERHSDFLVDADPGMSVVDALRRRDFTVNAMAWDPLTDEVMDPYFGRDALKNKVLDVVDPKTFVEDPLRVYRGVQFAARFGFVLSDRARALMTEMVAAGELRHIAPERVTDEFRKLLLRASKPSIGLVLMRELGVFEKHFPEIGALIGCAHEPEWHPEGDVFVHTCMVVDNAASLIRGGIVSGAQPFGELLEIEKEQLMVTALCHDMGKPVVSVKDSETGKIRSLGHEGAGVDVAKSFLNRFMFGGEIGDAVLGIVGDHLKPGQLFLSLQKGEMNEKQYANAVRKLLRRVAPASWRVLVALAEADFRGRGVGSVAGAYKDEEARVVYAAGEKLASVVLSAGIEETLKTTLVRGEDIMEIVKRLGLPEEKPGPRFGQLIRAVEDLRDQGEIVTREEGLEALERLMKG